MKKIYLVLLITLASSQIISSQAKKPSIMIVPSDNWCIEHGYTSDFDNLGVMLRLPDYSKALQEEYNLNSVISKIGELMADRGFPLIDLQSSLKKIEQNNAMGTVLTSNNSGAFLAESPLDILNRTAKADIIIKLSWKENKTGPKSSISFNLQGVDPYSNKQITAASGTGAPSFSLELTVLLEEAVLSYIDKFNDGLMNHFDDLFANGREGTLVIQTWDDYQYNLESEFDFMGRTAELKRIISSYWMPRNTVNGRFSQDEVSESIQKFSQVRIPLVGDDGWGGQIAMDFNNWGVQLSDFLKSEFGIVTKVQPRGLGEVNLILGGK